ncbi:MAG TPA: mechanosensitive ion channel family protein [Steroidobacteraceae bacterium]|nr:mechanosensitive ion channel family protein [Steroidobacteraceae bacterium]
MRRRSLFALLAAGICCGSLHAADSPDAAASSAQDSHVAVLTGEQVIKILDDTVDWYRTLGTQQQNANQPSDLLILFANRQTADKVVGLAFEIARANAELLSSEANAGQSAADASSPQALDQQKNHLAAQRQSITDEIKDDRQRAAVSGKAKQDIEAKLPELQGELAMVDARKNLLDTMADFVNESNPKGAGANALKAHIDAIAATIPASNANAAPASLAGAPSPGSAAAMPSTALDTAPTRYGIWDLGGSVLKLRGKIKTIDVIDRHTGALAQTFQTISAPPLTQLKAYSARSDALASQADNASSAVLKDLRSEFDTLAWLFKQTSAILIPLTKEQVLLQQYRHNLRNWRDATQRQYLDALAALGVRLGILAGILAAVFVLAEIWRRAVLRYAHEARRRYQLLLIRKIVLWTAVVAIVGLSFATEIRSLATFAGLITAGVAVAMQSVLVSVVGYFFLIGKYGIRVGDRIQIGTVVGEVIDLGLVRLHLMELNTQGPLGPTGRVVAFANLVVFQASGGLFKQIPGVNLSWHETTLSLPAVSDYAALKDKLLAAVNHVTSEYREEIARQTKEIERTTATSSVNDGAPQVQMHLAAGHMEALIRYPVHLKHAAEIDERVSTAVLKVIAENT